jgi:hypothetical protein
MKTMKCLLTTVSALAAVVSIAVPAAAQPTATPVPGPTPAAAPPEPTTGVTPPAGGTVTPPPAEEEDLSMTFHATRPKDMQNFAEGSLQEIQIGKTKPRYAMNLFGDVSFGASSRSEGDTRPDPAFAVGVFDMLFNAELESKILATSEVTFQYEPNAPLAELERLHIRWKPNKTFFLEVGRFHTDIGYWNVAYHHGKWLQLPIERPRTIQLHGGLLPVHWIGAQSGLSAPVGKGTITLVGSVGSARDPIGSGAHQGHSTAFTPVNGGHVKLEAAGIGLADLHFGVAGIYDRIQGEPAVVRPGLPDQGIDEYVGNVFVAVPSVPFSLIAEAYEIQHQIPKGDLSSGQAGAKWRAYGAFAMMGYAIGRVTPYIKGEYVTSKANTALPDPFFIPEPKSVHGPSVALDLVEGVIGARIETSTWSSLKLEYRLTTGQGNRRADLPKPAIHTMTAGWSFGI